MERSPLLPAPATLNGWETQKLTYHKSERTTGLYDQRDDEVSLDQIEKIVI